MTMSARPVCTDNRLLDPILGRVAELVAEHRQYLPRALTVRRHRDGEGWVAELYTPDGTADQDRPPIQLYGHVDFGLVDLYSGQARSIKFRNVEPRVVAVTIAALWGLSHD